MDIEKLGTYFVYHDLHNRYGITFERFVHMVKLGVWHYWTSK